ncbi:MAG: TlpA disulfide reductase family protein [Bacteroidales bacterium]|jgi:thiol-disulfide isomerase/thioredoxin|nr:TlpA disulfide reductase family protein [Bacteroidales bacterium]
MRNFLLIGFLLIGLITNSCKEKSTEAFNRTVYIYGNIITDEIKTNFILNKFNIITDESESFLVEIDTNGYFQYSLRLDFPQIILFRFESNEIFHVFATPGDSISFDLKDSLDVQYSNTEHQIFNSNLNIIRNEIQKYGYNELNTRNHINLKEKDFKLFLDSIKSGLNKRINILYLQNDWDKSILQVAKNEIDFFYAVCMVDYQYINKIVFKIDKDIPDEYYSIVDSLFQNYNELIVTHITNDFLNRIQLRYISPLTDTTINNVLKLDSSLLRDILLCRAIYSAVSLKDFEKAQHWFDIYSGMIQNEILSNQLVDEYSKSYEAFKNPKLETAKLKELVKNDHTGIFKEIVKSHPDKVLYIKFWMPTCGPCMAQLPYLKEIEDKLNPNVFMVINICMPFPKDKWMATIKEKNISGVHYLLTETQSNQLKAAFNMNGIPRYVLINKKGIIVDQDAPIPGDMVMQGVNFDLVKKIEELIKN